MEEEKDERMKLFVRMICACSLLTVPVCAQVQAHSVDLNGYGGWAHEGLGSITTSNAQFDIPTANRAIYGGGAGYNVTPYVTIMGEYGYVPLESDGGVNLNTQMYGGGVRVNLTPHKSIVPYGVFNGGGDKLVGTCCESITSRSYSYLAASANGYYIGAGGGADFYVGKHWGFRPEFRYLRNEFSYHGVDLSLNNFAFTAGVFVQVGGRSKKKADNLTR
jgi:hypothetical protein